MFKHDKSMLGNAVMLGGVKTHRPRKWLEELSRTAWRKRECMHWRRPGWKRAGSIARDSMYIETPCIYIYIYVCMYIYIYIYICMYACVCEYICMYVCMCIHIYTYTCVCVYIYVCVYIHIYIYIYIYILDQGVRSPLDQCGSRRAALRGCDRAAQKAERLQGEALV